MSCILPRALLRVVVITSIAWRTVAAQAAEPVRVLVSRREVRVIFPIDTARSWGWPDQTTPGFSPAYVWGIIVEGMDGPRILWVRLDSHTDKSRRFPSLERLIAAAHAQRCLPGMVAQCTDSAMRASVERGQVVLALRDSTQVARLFGMRPTSVQAWQQRPGEHDRYSSDTVNVQYVAPEIPLPTAATRQDAARSRRRYLASITTILRFLEGGEPFRPLWLEVGDSVAVSVAEMHCYHDSCSSGGDPMLLDSGWTILDSAIARLHTVPRDSTDDIADLLRRQQKYVKALRAGRTVLRVRGLRGPSDTAASSTPPARQIEREIIVAPPIARLEIEPRPDSVRALETFTLRVRVLDREGREVSGLPWQLEVLDGESRGIRAGPDPQSLVFRAPGQRRITARLGAHTDTLSLLIVPPNAK